VAIWCFDRRIEHRVGGADGLAVTRPPPLIVLLERVETDACLPHEPGREALNVTRLLRHGEGV